MRIYLVVVDESPEAEIALRFAARRAAKTGGGVEILALVPTAEFVPWGGVQATIEEEARQHAEGLVAAASGTLLEESGIHPRITVKQGEASKVIRDVIANNPEIAALVLAAAPGASPGPLVSHFAAAGLPIPLMIIPGSLSGEAIDRLS